jgi:hypothetical protein
MEGLEDEPDVPAAHRVGAAGIEALAGDLHRPRVTRVQPAEEVQQRRLARARAADDGDDLTRRDVEVDAVEDPPRRAAATVVLDEPAGAHDRVHRARLGRGSRRRAGRMAGGRRLARRRPRGGEGWPSGRVSWTR